MISFKEFIQEAKDGKLKHLEHIEDFIINDGYDGAVQAILHLSELRSKFTGTSTNIDISVKWDGAPSLICGTNPENNKFFVGTKGVFAKNPKLMYTNEDINSMYSGDLAIKLSTALNVLSQVGIKGIIQGDFLYTKDDLKKEEIDDISYITFKPNTITYAVPSDSELGKKILKTEMGIVFHTSYTGNTIADMKAQFGANVDYLKSSKAWITSATFKDETGVVSFSNDEATKFEKQLNMAKGSLKKCKDILEDINLDKDIFSLGSRFKIFMNSKVRNGQEFVDVRQIQRDFYDYYENYIESEIDSKKSDKGKQKYIQQLEDAKLYLESNINEIYMMIATYVTIHNCKNILVQKLNKLDSMKTFLKTADGYKITNPEGFVGIKDGQAFKLIDRLEFSRANFTITKDWK